MFFRGVKNLNLDAKGRLAIPPRYREYLSGLCGGELVVTIEQSGCLMIYPLPEWESREQRLMACPSLDKHVQALQRLYVGYATDTAFDTQGRILIPPPLRRFATLDKKVVLVGQGHRFDLWDEQRWMENQHQWLEAAANMDGAALPDSLKDFSF